MRKLAQFTAVTVVASGLSLAGGGVALARPIVCDANQVTTTVSGVQSSQKVTHAIAEENYTGSTATRTVSATRQTTITAGFTVTTEAKTDAGAIFAKVSASVGVSVAADKASTSTTTESVTYQMKTGDRYIFFAGDKYITAVYDQKRCNSDGSAETDQSGHVRTFAVYTEGGVGCHVAAGAGTLAEAAKAYC